MNFLFDTHILLWTIAGDERLPARVRALLADPGNDFRFSAASVWEVAIKNALPRRALGISGNSFRREVLAAGFREIPVSSEHAAVVETLPPVHQDPFDRLLVAQAKADGLVLVTHNLLLPPYGPFVMLV